MNSLLNTSKFIIKRTLNTALTNLLRNGSLINKSNNTRICLYSSTESANTAANTKPLITYPSPSSDKQYPENIRKIVSDISQLTLLEVSELNELLKKTLNISDTPMMAFGAMPTASQPAAEDDEEESSFKSVQTAFTLKLNKFDDTKKVILIKEVKNIVEGMNLVQAKKFVESVPQTLKTNLSKDEAENLKSKLEALGGICEIV